MAEQITNRLMGRYDHLCGLGDMDFCRQLDSYLRIAGSDRTVRRILKQLREETAAAVPDFAALDRALSAELVGIRDRLVAGAPEIAPDTDPPEPGDQIRHREWVMETISGFDQQARAPEPEIRFEPLPHYSERANPGRTQALVQILRGRLYAAEWGVRFGRGQPPTAKLRTDLAAFGDEVEDVQARYSAARATFKQQEKTLAGLAAARLQLVAEKLTPEPFTHDPNEDDAARMERALQRVLEQMSDIGAMQRVVAGERLTGSDQTMFDRLARFLRGELDRLHTELLDRLQREQGSIRSRIRNMSGKALAISATVIIGIAVTGSLGYAQNWIWHHNGRGRGGGHPTPQTSTGHSTSSS